MPSHKTIKSVRPHYIACASLVALFAVSAEAALPGVGPWTSSIYLLMVLGRPDVWPVGDGGIQRAALNLYRIRSPRSLQKLGERFRPVRTHAAWYLWRSLDEA